MSAKVELKEVLQKQTDVTTNSSPRGEIKLFERSPSAKGDYIDKNFLMNIDNNQSNTKKDLFSRQKSQQSKYAVND